MYVYAIGAGRFGNIFIRNMAAHFIAKNNNMTPVYYERHLFDILGINLFEPVTESTSESAVNESASETTLLTDDNFMEYMSTKHPITTNLSLNEIYCQTKPFSIYLYNYFKDHDVRQDIQNKNKYASRYNNNNDVFLHIRLDDITQYNPGEKYYNDLLERITFENGFISSDTPHHPICTNLAKKFNLKILYTDILDTMKFGSTCKTIILSNGTFSYVLGLLGFYSTIYYPEIKHRWHGDIFVIDSWNEIKL